MTRLLNFLEHAARLWLDYIFRRRSVGMALITLGVGLLIAVISGFVFKLTVPTAQGPFALSFSTDTGAAAWLTYGLTGIGVGLIAIGLLRLREELRAAGRKRTVAIELRGLRDWNGAPLIDAISEFKEGRRDEVVIDVRQGVTDGKIIDAEVALTKLAALRPRLETIEAGRDRRDITYVAGGLGPVPFTFLLGLLVDDESPVTIMDWHRDHLVWRELTEPDDGKRFAVTGVNDALGATAVAIAISSSYSVDAEAVRAKLNRIPIVRLDLEGRSTTSHWSGPKQAALAAQFRETVLQLANTGTKQIHLFFAGPASLVLRFGMTYDKRNLPAVTVYQFDQSAVPPFPWGVEMPVAGKAAATVVRQPC
jgi:hypothetical protein